MIQHPLQSHATRFYSAVYSLDRFFSPRNRVILSWISGVVTCLFLILTCLIFLAHYPFGQWLSLPLSYLLTYVDMIPGINITQGELLYTYTFAHGFSLSFPYVTGLGLWNILFGLSIFSYVGTKLCTLFARSVYFEDLFALERSTHPVLSYAVSEIFLNTTEGDVFFSFAAHPVGKQFFKRLEISDQELLQFLATRLHITDYREVPSIFQVKNLQELMTTLSRSEDVFIWLQRKGIQQEDIDIAAAWTYSEYRASMERERWWGRVTLSHTPVLGEEMAYGYGLLMKKFTSQMHPKESHVRFSDVSQEDPVPQLIEMLLRSDGSNALVITPSISQGIDVVESAIVYISHSLHPRFTHKHCLLFDVAYFEQQISTREEFEHILTSVLLDAYRSGNAILIIDNIAALIHRATLLGADIDGILKPVLESSALQLIAVVDVEQFHGVLASHNRVTQLFHELHLEELSDAEHLRRLVVYVEHVEREQGVFFSSLAVKQILVDANRTLTHRSLFDQSRDILVGMTSFVQREGTAYITKALVDDYVSAHAHVPVGMASGDEEILLLNLEKVLHQSVVGQERAIHAVSQALRRSRLNLRNEHRPIASFLFFGPTGVGKTEVAKTIAREYFHSEDSLHRFDMSEFSDQSALARFIGGDGSGDGALVARLLERPYAVLLLDEFEKAHASIHDLFLQIIDEGYFHDARSRKIHCSNLVIIATSNVAAEEIYARIREGGTLSDAMERQLVAHIIEKGEFRPELLNRFDDLVLFHPLSAEALQHIAILMLDKLAKRMLEKGIVLKTSEPLIQFLMKHGVDPLFGARPMQRAIQDYVEPIIAEKMLRHELSSGMVLELQESDLHT